MVVNDGRAVFYCRQKTRGEYDLIKAQLEKSIFKIKAST